MKGCWLRLPKPPPEILRQFPNLVAEVPQALLGQLLEEVALGLEPAGGVGDDDVVAAAPRSVDAIEDH